MRVWLAMMFSAAAVAAAPRAVLLHDELGPMETLGAALTKSGFEAAVQEQSVFTPKTDVVFMYVHGDLKPSVRDALIAWAERGGRLIVLHHGMASGKMRSPRWPEFLGVRILPRDAPENAWIVLRGDVDVVNLAPGHWITTHEVRWPETVAYVPSDAPSAEQQLPAFRLRDTEFFHNQLFTDARRKTVLLGVKITSGGRTIMQDRGGWMMPAGKG
ncbi:MAG TPA: hypothetical protein VFL57_01725, partial [Bryobacteraceae bacterium]|nr:hypothetical protein [Bryobacteraceae bacterium]